MDKTRAFHTECSKSERENVVLTHLYGIIYALSIWELYICSLQGRDRDVELEKRLVDTVGEVEGGWDELGD